MNAEDNLKDYYTNIELNDGISTSKSRRASSTNVGASHIKLKVITWNVGAKSPPGDLERLLIPDQQPSQQPSLHHIPNVYAICLQEVQDLSKIIAFEDWTTCITDIMCRLHYFRIKVIKMIGLLLMIFVRKTDLTYVTNVETGYTKTGFKGLWGNKGAVAIRFLIDGIYICVMNCHLAAHACEMNARIQDYTSIVKNLKFRYSTIEAILDHDYVFCVGDLNFRFMADISETDIRRCIAEKNYDKLKDHDQLIHIMNNKLMLLDFKEGEIKFTPTYKFDVGTDTYDTSNKKRIPAWCDRILWMCNEDAFHGIRLHCHQLNYKCDMSFKLSDHKPVSSDFVVTCLKNPNELPVTFEHFRKINISGESLLVRYMIPSGDHYKLHTNDWIGLYKDSFSYDMDYERFVYVQIIDNPTTQTASVSFSSTATVTLVSGTYHCCYYSYLKDCIIGYSKSLQFINQP